MQPDPLPAREGGDPVHLRLVEGLAVSSADRGLDRDHRHLSRHTPAGGAADDLLHLLEREGRPARRQRHQGDRAQGLDAVARVVEQVALGLDDGSPRPAGERAHGEMVGQRTGRHEDGPLLPEQRRGQLLQFLDRPTVRVGVPVDPSVVGQPGQQPCLVGRRQSEPVPGHPHPRGRRLGRSARHPGATLGQHGARLEEPCAEPQSAGPQEPSSVDAVHGAAPPGRPPPRLPGRPVPVLEGTV